MGSETQTLINKEVKKKFPNYSFGELSYFLTPRDIISFAYLYKQLTFRAKFSRMKKGFCFDGRQVESFEAKEEAQKSQICVHSFKSREDFCISIPDRASSDLLFLIKSEAEMIVDEAVNLAVLAENTGAPMTSYDIFEMPVINIDCQRTY